MLWLQFGTGNSHLPTIIYFDQFFVYVFCVKAGMCNQIKSKLRSTQGKYLSVNKWIEIYILNSDKCGRC